MEQAEATIRDLTQRLYGILVFMLDDLFVFFVAMKTLQVTGLTGAYVRHAHAIGGAVLIVIGLMLLFKPEWLVFAV